MESGFDCAACGSWNPIWIAPEGGREQRYVEDCQTCCRPNTLLIYWDDAAAEYVVGEAVLEDA